MTILLSKDAVRTKNYFSSTTYDISQGMLELRP